MRMNKLPLAKRAPNPLHAVRGIVHAVDQPHCGRVDQHRVKLLVDAGRACLAIHDETVRGVKATPHPVRRDLVVLLCQGEERRDREGRARKALATCGRGPRSTPTRKLIVSYLVGDRSASARWSFMDDLRAPAGQSRAAHHGRPQGLPGGRRGRLRRRRGLCAAREALRQPTGEGSEPLQPGRMHRHHEAAGRWQARHRRTSARQLRRAPEPHDADAHAPVHPADQRLLEEVENHMHVVALYFVFYNFFRIHKTLRMSPAMAAGITDGSGRWRMWWPRWTSWPRRPRSAGLTRSGLHEKRGANPSLAPLSGEPVRNGENATIMHNKADMSRFRY